MNKKTVNLVFRLDDFSAVSSTGIEREVITLFRQHRVALTIGVVPFVCSHDFGDPTEQILLPLPADKVDFLRQAVNDATIDVALHGYSHQTVGINRKTEFAGIGLEAQLEKLTRGKTALENTIASSVSIFIPPWNSYDLETIQVLDHLKMAVISADWKGPAAQGTNLKFLPATTDLMHIHDAISDASCSPDKQPLIVVLFHLYDFKEFGGDHGCITLQKLAEELNWIKQKEGIRILSISQALDLIEDLSVHRFLAVEAWREVQTVTPPILREKTPVLVFHERSILRRALWRLMTFYALLAVFFLALATSTGFLWSSNSHAIRMIAALCWAISGVMGSYIVWRFEVSPGAIVSGFRVMRYWSRFYPLAMRTSRPISQMLP
jgi:peptidoglycan/xylan/chitin deacetylase (PgdA/CDA1 family)